MPSFLYLVSSSKRSSAPWDKIKKTKSLRRLSTPKLWMYMFRAKLCHIARYDCKAHKDSSGRSKTRVQHFSHQPYLCYVDRALQRITFFVWFWLITPYYSAFGDPIDMLILLIRNQGVELGAMVLMISSRNEKEGGKSHHGYRREKIDHRPLPIYYTSIVDI